MSIKTFEKQPADEQDYDIDYTDYVVGMGEDVSDEHTIEYLVVEDGLTLDSQSIHNGFPIDGVPSCFIKIWVSGGEPGLYKVTARLRTAGGRLHEREIRIRVRDR